MSFAKIAATSVAAIALATAASARDNVQIAGSSTVLPYANIVAEAFGAEAYSNFKTPDRRSPAARRPVCKPNSAEGVGEGIHRHCERFAGHPRKAKSRPAPPSGVTDIMEIRIGYDGIVFASDINGPEFAFEPVHWYIALAAEHFIDGELVANELTNWEEVAEIAQSLGIDGDLPDQDINAFIPGTNHGTREVFDENVVLAGCEQGGFFEAMIAAGVDEDTAEDACMAIRTDGASVDIEGDYTQTLANLDSTPNGIGVFGLAFYENNTDRLQVATMSGIVPNTETISTGEYPVSRPLFFYIKAAHIGVIPGLKEYAAFFMSDAIAGGEGPLAAYGLVADPEIAATQAMIEAEETM